MISRRRALIFGGGLVFLITTGLGLLGIFDLVECKKCDILLITIDRWDYKDAGKLNFSDQKAVFFDNAVSNSTWALPSYVSMYSGDYPGEQGVWEVGDKIKSVEGNFVSKLKAAGYKTKAYSLGPFFQTQWGFGEGFDEFTEAKDLADLENLYESNKRLGKQKSSSEFVWLRFGSAGLVSDYEASIDQVLGMVNKILADKGLENTKIVVVGAAGKLSSEPKNESISVPLYVWLENTRQELNKSSVFELKDIGKLLLSDSEFINNQNQIQDKVGLSSVAETEENIRSFYTKYQPGMGSGLKVREEEWTGQNFSSARSEGWHLVRNKNNEYFLYDLAQDSGENNNLFGAWSTLPELERKEAIGVIRLLGGDVPKVCGIYCGSYDFFK